MINRSSSQRKQQQQQQPRQRGGLLSTRILNSLPYVDSVKDYYLRTKQGNEALRIGLNLAEYCASTAATPFLGRYQALDKFAGQQLDKLEDQYGEDLISKSVGVVAYPIGFTLGLAGYARNKVLGVANPAIKMSYEWADVVIDNLMPPDSDESMEEEYRKMKNLELRSPFSRIRDRTTLSSVRRLPGNAFNFSWNVFSSAAYMSLGFTQMSMERMINSVNVLLSNVNLVFDEVLQHPWTAISNTDFSKLYHALVFYGVKNVNTYIAEVEKLALDLSQYLENRNLPYNAQVVGYIASKVRQIERRLVRLGGLIQEAPTTNVELTSSRSQRKVDGHRPRMVMDTPRRVYAPDKRIPSMVVGDAASSLPTDEHEEIKEDEHEEEEIEVEEPALADKRSQNRVSMFARVTAERKKYSKRALAKKESKQFAAAEPVEPTVRPIKPSEEIEETVDPNVDEHGYAPVKAKSHDHLIPASVAQEMGKEILHKPAHKRHQIPVTPTNSPADALQNPFSAIEVPDDKIVSGPARNVDLKEVEEHQKSLRHKALNEIIKTVADRLEGDEAAQRAERHAELPAWEQPKHPAHVHVEELVPETKAEELPAVENNPFGKLAEVNPAEDPLSAGVSGM